MASCATSFEFPSSLFPLGRRPGKIKWVCFI